MIFEVFFVAKLKTLVSSIMTTHISYVERTGVEGTAVFVFRTEHGGIQGLSKGQ